MGTRNNSHRHLYFKGHLEKDLIKKPLVIELFSLKTLYNLHEYHNKMMKILPP